MASRNKQNNIHPTSTFTPVRSADSSLRDCVVREMKTVEDILVNQCNMPSDSHNILQIHHRLFTSMNKLPRLLSLRSLPLLVACGVSEFLFIYFGKFRICRSPLLLSSRFKIFDLAGYRTPGPLNQR